MSNIPTEQFLVLKNQGHPLCWGDAEAYIGLAEALNSARRASSRGKLWGVFQLVYISEPIAVTAPPPNLSTEQYAQWLALGHNGNGNAGGHSE